MLEVYIHRALPHTHTPPMSAHIDREVPPTSRLQHILSVGLHARNSDISVTTRANTTNRAMSEFKNCPEVSMGRTHLTLSRVAEEALRSSMVSARPLVIRSALTERDAMALIDENEWNEKSGIYATWSSPASPLGGARLPCPKE